MTKVPSTEASAQFGTRGHNSGWIDKRLIEKIKYAPVERLKFYDRNPRTHGKRQANKLDKSIAAFGLVAPVLIDTDGLIVAGEAVVQSAIRLGYTEIPVVEISHLEPRAVKALRIALNRLPELASWDEEALAIEFRDILEIDFDVELTGYETAEIDLIVDANAAVIPQSPADSIPEQQGAVVSELGDVWRLDDHIVGCSDARDSGSYRALKLDRKAAMVITDPPYNVRIAGHVSGLGATKHDDFVMASGEMSDAEFEAFLAGFVRNAVDFSAPGSVHFIFMDWRHLHVLERVCHQFYASQLNLCVWAKSNGGMGSLYRSQHELCTVFKNGTEPHINNVELGRFGRNRTNLWRYEGCNSLSSNRRADLELHPTVKPVAMIADAIRDASRRGDLVLDPFLGSGTTLIACEETGRVCAGLELDPKYVDVILGRWQAFTGNQAIHVETGFSFEEVGDIRSGKQLQLPAPKTGEEG